METSAKWLLRGIIVQSGASAIYSGIEWIDAVENRALYVFLGLLCGFTCILLQLKADSLLAPEPTE